VEDEQAVVAALDHRSDAAQLPFGAVQPTKNVGLG
jgi:hypothetical protein